MDKSYLLELLQKYLKGDASKEEAQFLLSYYDLFDSESDVLKSLTDEQKSQLEGQMEKNIWENVKLHEDSDVKKAGSIWTKLIAAAAVILVLTTGIYFINKSPQKKDNALSRTESKDHRLVRLPDGSTVIVSVGSKLNYPSSFDGHTRREVYLEGQAYFDVKHNSSKPFIIHTGKIETIVLGTAFNIKAWPGDDDITVTVTRGKVKVGYPNKTFGVITPNQQIVYNKESNDVSKKNVDAQEYLAWKEQDLLLDNVTVAEAVELLETRFKVNITISDEQIATSRFTTAFLKGETLEEVLKSVCEFNNGTYTYDKEKAAVVIRNAQAQ
jgi:transmembrane sensor